ncbi:hypothetical protein AB0L14_35520 [Streptomyces sp. NPDC052727]|uniref:hypothetical protein n=1 Tax=Streptomyces sp. NPDC052727 TaxID=3154854 RepID=UPI0034476BF2
MPAPHRAPDRLVTRDPALPKPPEGHLNLLRHVAGHEGVTVREAAAGSIPLPTEP